MPNSSNKQTKPATFCQNSGYMSNMRSLVHQPWCTIF